MPWRFIKARCGAQIDTGDRTPGWRLARQADRRKERADLHGVSRTVVLVPVLAGTRADDICKGIGTRNQLEREGQESRCADHDLPHRIDRHATPVEDAQVARKTNVRLVDGGV